MSGEPVVLYKCDPSKNTRCNKKNCYMNKLLVDPQCNATRYKEFAKLPLENVTLVIPMEDDLMKGVVKDV